MLLYKGWSRTHYDCLCPHQTKSTNHLEEKDRKTVILNKELKVNQYHDPPQNVTRIHDFP